MHYLIMLGGVFYLGVLLKRYRDDPDWFREPLWDPDRKDESGKEDEAAERDSVG